MLLGHKKLETTALCAQVATATLREVTSPLERLTLSDPSRQALEVADIVRDHGPAWHREQAGHLSFGQLKVMPAIERCRTAALGGHVEHCPDCGHSRIAYNSLP